MDCFAIDREEGEGREVAISNIRPWRPPGPVSGDALLKAMRRLDKEQRLRLLVLICRRLANERERR